MKPSKYLCALILPALLLTGCGEKDDEMTIRYSDDEIHIQYNGEDIEYDLSGNPSDTTEVPDYDPAMVIDLFADVEDWLVYDGTDDNGTVNYLVPLDYLRECNGYYFKYYNVYRQKNSTATSSAVFTVIRDNELVGYLYYYIENRTDLTKGEHYNSYIQMMNANMFMIEPDELFGETGHIILETKRDYVYQGTGGKTITSADQLTQKHLDTAGDYIYDLANNEYLDQAGIFSPDEFWFYNIEKVYFAELKPASILSYKGKSMLTFIITNKGQTYTVDLYGLSLDANDEFIITDNTSYKGEFFDQNFSYTELDVDM